MNKKKILIVTASLGLGGSEKALTEMVNLFDFDKYDVDVLSLLKNIDVSMIHKRANVINGYIKFDVNESLKKSILPLLCKGDFRLVYNRIRFSISCKNNKSNTHTSKFYWKYFKNMIPTYEEEYDIVIGYGQGIATYFAHDKVNAKKKILWLNTDLEKAHYDINFVKKFYLNADYIFADSLNGKNNVCRLFPEMSDRVFVFKNILNENEIKLKGDEAIQEHLTNKNMILSIGRLVEAKAFHLAVSAAKMLKDRGLDFVWYIVGEGSDRESLELQIKELRLEKNIVLLGKRINPYPYLKCCDYYVQTSIYEGSCITLDEAMIFKKPIVTTDFPAAKEKIFHKKNGYIVTMEPEAIAEGIETMIKDNQLRNKCINYLTENKQNYSEQMQMLYDVFY